MLTAHWAEDDLLMGDSMEHIEGEICLGGFSVLVQKNSWMSATSPHVLSWCSLQLETSPMHTPYQTWLQHFLSCFIITWMVAILLYGYGWQVSQSLWLEHGELTIATGAGISVLVAEKAVKVFHILKAKS